MHCWHPSPVRSRMRGSMNCRCTAGQGSPAWGSVPPLDAEWCSGAARLKPTHWGPCPPLLSIWLGCNQNGLCWAFEFPGSTSRCHWLWSLHCLEKGKVLQWGREEISWQQNTRLAFCRECVFVGGRQNDAKFDIPPREIILPSTLGWQISVLPLLLRSLQPELVFATDYKAREGKGGIVSRRECCARARPASCTATGYILKERVT